MAEQVLGYDQGVKRDDKATAQESPTLENDLVRKINQLIKQANRATKNYRQQWSENYRFVVNGEQWSIRRPRWRFSEVVNRTWSNIVTEVGIQTDSRPKFTFAATEPGDFQFAKVLNEINDVLWSKPSNQGYGWLKKTSSAIFKSKIKHVVHAEVCWDETLENGLGDVGYKVLEPEECFWDPLAKDIGDCRWFIHVKPTPTVELKSKHPKQAYQIKPDVHNFTTGNDKVSDTNVDRFFASYGAVNPNVNAGRADRSTDQYGGEDMTALIRCWIKDDATVENIEKKEDGTEELVIQKKFPRGRYVEFCNKVILKDIENPYEDGLFPIARLVNYEYGEYMGENEVTHQKGPQKITNYTYSHMMDEFKRGSSPQKIVTQRAQDVAKKLTDEPGLTVVVPELSDIRMEQGVGVTPSTFNVLETSKQMHDEISGLADSVKGQSQTGVTSALMFEGVVEAAQTRPRLKNRSVDDFLGQVGLLTASRILQYYTAVRSLRVTNEQGFPQFIQFYIKKDEAGNRVASVQRQVTTEAGVQAGQAMEFQAKGLPDVTVNSGSSLPYSRAIKTKQATELYQMGALTLEDFLDAIDWPNPKETAKKVMEQQQAQAQMQGASK